MNAEDMRASGSGASCGFACSTRGQLEKTPHNGLMFSHEPHSRRNIKTSMLFSPNDNNYFVK
jgi:hypothetical protein